MSVLLHHLILCRPALMHQREIKTSGAKFHGALHSSRRRAEKKKRHNHNAGFERVLTGCHTFVHLAFLHTREEDGHSAGWLTAVTHLNTGRLGPRWLQSEAD